MTATAARPLPAARRRGGYWARYRHALWLLTSRDLKVRYTTSALGYLWSIIDPLMMGGIYWFVFGVVLHRGNQNLSEQPYIIFLLTALLPWTWFNGNLGDATKAFRSEAKLIRSVKIPRTIWVLRQVAAKGIEFVISLSVIAVFALITLTPPKLETLWCLPIALVLQVVLTVGINLIIAPLSVFLRDLERIVRLALRVLFYASPVLYRFALDRPGQEGLHILYGFNPLAGIFDLYRSCFFPQVLDWQYVLQSAVVTVVLFFVGIAVFKRAIPAVLKEI